MKGYVQVYTGDGKGKTTAALGLALRAAGAGKKVFIAQFVKGMEYCELDSLAHLAPFIECKQFGRKKFIHGEPEPEDYAAAENGLNEVRSMIQSRIFDVIILDEMNVALDMKLIPLEDVLSLIDEKPEDLELILTGRNAHPRIIERAHLVTEMRNIKHYFQKGVQARKGIEM
jgi:cob(I)alamin adenosyltransferase